MIKRGFSLIEIMIAVLIASLVVTGLFITISQLGDTQGSLNRIISAQERAAIMLHQFERDCMGAFIPEQIARIQTKDQKEKEEEKSVIDKIFYGTDRDGNLDLLTFITCNPLDVYLKIKNTKPKPRVARVVYRLVPEKGRKNSFALMRQEGADLDFKRYKKDAKDDFRAYAMIEGIASLQINYLKIDTEKKETEDGVRSYKKEKNWGTQEKKEGKKPIVLPEYLDIAVDLWNSDYETKTNFKMQIPILIEPMIPKKTVSIPSQPIQNFSNLPLVKPMAQANKPKKVSSKSHAIAVALMEEAS